MDYFMIRNERFSRIMQMGINVNLLSSPVQKTEDFPHGLVEKSEGFFG